LRRNASLAAEAGNCSASAVERFSIGKAGNVPPAHPLGAQLRRGHHASSKSFAKATANHRQTLPGISREIEWSAFADSTRWHICTLTFDGIADALRRTRQTYRRDLWSTQPYYVELWLEKDAIASIVRDLARDFGVPIFVCRGFASLSSLYSAAQTFRRATRNGKAVQIFHLGDYDPSGHAAADAIERTLIEDFNCDLEFKRLAVTPLQIEWLNLPTRPTKQTDSRARNWAGAECVELDSMPPAKMRAIVQEAITDCIEPEAWEALQKVEAAERESLAKMSLVA
jgi:hypothetical protein